MNDSLLPRNSTKLERDLEKLIARADSLPIELRALWSPYDCPLDLLPWLAWALSVDYWEESWPEKTKRQVVAAAFDVHKHKATPHAVKTALDSLGVATKITEWWEPGGSGVRGTMTVFAMINDNIVGAQSLIGPEMLAQITRAIDTAKRGSIHYDVELGIYLDEGFGFALGAACGVGIADEAFAAGAVLPDSTSANMLYGGAVQHVVFSDSAPAARGVAPDELPGSACVAAVCRLAILSDIGLLGVH